MVKVVDELAESASELTKSAENRQLQKLEYRIPHQLYPPEANNNVKIKNILKHFLAITSNCKSEIQNDFAIKKFCHLAVDIELKNLSNTLEFDLIILARNNLK